jgi:hypothetical protein
MLRRILHELKNHAPFTLLGALTGVVLLTVVVLLRMPHEQLHAFFESLHAVHVLLSAIVTAAMYRRYRKSLLACVIVGFVGSVGIGTLSDIVLPFLGGKLMGAEMHPIHVGFIEHWWLINPVALLGVAIGISWPKTKVPHFGHVLLSTWASVLYLPAYGEANWLTLLPVVAAVLFVAVWLPCCVSDIVFPLLFVGKSAAAQELDHHHHEHTEPAGGVE